LRGSRSRTPRATAAQQRASCSSIQADLTNLGPGRAVGARRHPVSRGWGHRSARRKPRLVPRRIDAVGAAASGGLLWPDPATGRLERSSALPAGSVRGRLGLRIPSSPRANLPSSARISASSTGDGPNRSPDGRSGWPAHASASPCSAQLRLEQGPDGHHRGDLRDGGELPDRQLAVDDPVHERVLGDPENPRWRVGLVSGVCNPSVRRSSGGDDSCRPRPITLRR
jgi:hypothetical protein